MPKFTLICEHQNLIHNGDVESKNTLEFNKEDLFDVIEQFETFLKGCGYYFDGQLDIVKDELEDDYSDRIQNDLDYCAAQPTLNVGLDEIKIDDDVSSAAWPFPLNERPA